MGIDPRELAFKGALEGILFSLRLDTLAQIVQSLPPPTSFIAFLNPATTEGPSPSWEAAWMAACHVSSEEQAGPSEGSAMQLGAPGSRGCGDA